VVGLWASREVCGDRSCLQHLMLGLVRFVRLSGVILRKQMQQRDNAFKLCNAKSSHTGHAKSEMLTRNVAKQLVLLQIVGCQSIFMFARI
jgi:hypothetical protein